MSLSFECLRGDSQPQTASVAKESMNSGRDILHFTIRGSRGEELEALDELMTE